MVGTVISTVDPVFAELAASRFDFVWIDLEHSALSPSDVQTLVICAAAADAFSMIRLGDSEPGALGALLDTGVDGVVLPRAEDPGRVEAVTRLLEFPPSGVRGYAPRRAALVKRESSSPRRPACIVQVESQRAVDNAGDLAQLETCDALVIGLNDLSLNLGVAPALDGPELTDAVRSVRSAADQAGKGWGVAVGRDSSCLDRIIADGGTLVYSSDVGLFAGAIDQAARAFRP